MTVTNDSAGGVSGDGGAGETSGVDRAGDAGRASGTGGAAESEARGVVITGGGVGIGRAAARAFAAEGANVLIVGRTEADLIETAKGDDGEKGVGGGDGAASAEGSGDPTGSIHVLAADLTEPDVPRLVVETALRRLGRIDVLVNNAAATGYATLDQIDRQTAQTQLATNLLAPVFLTQCALDALEATRGTVVNLSTAGSLGLRSWPGAGLYGASKVGLDFLTRTWAVELAPRGIRVVGIAPGVIDTGVGLRMGMSEQQYQGFLTQMAERAPAGRIGTCAEIGWWITRLAGPEAGYLNGVVVPVDGGLSVT